MKRVNMNSFNLRSLCYALYKQSCRMRCTYTTWIPATIVGRIRYELCEYRNPTLNTIKTPALLQQGLVFLKTHQTHQSVNNQNVAHRIHEYVQHHSAE